MVLWAWQLEALSLLGLEEGVGEGDSVHFGHGRIVVELRVDVEEDGHVNLRGGKRERERLI